MTLEVQFLSMLASVGVGIWFGASFDTYKRFIGSPQRFRWTLLVNDILFWLVQALIFFYVLLQVNQGEVRFYLFLAVLLGYSIYRSLFEKIYLRILEWMIHFTVKTYNIIANAIKVLVINPIKWLLKVLLSLSMILLTTIWRIIYILFRIIIFPVRWIANKYVQAYGNPLESFINRLKRVVNNVKKQCRKIVNKFSGKR
ncbi:spore cortex biosynthesis protein YabQ [Evansella sp. AB-P1]|uniref:spore cortex biosynthesis protein YabQ n=1 Tax=Evansella sp. AB-P1 TaxID=3037653 RepID=UPI00241DCE94|nr:spore cortex biosynthesis protein YabQ [Evansella sp. AB-P1]MDG5789991.1 spore cortex biosynthesis protein YabQ [Evansella sp. AB-P1]